MQNTVHNTVHVVSKTLLGGPLSPGEHLTGFIGGVAADEPAAALAAREVLATGGSAADAAVTLGFMLSVTLPSRASLGAGGACIAYQPGANAPGHGVPEAVLFTPRAPATNAGDRPAAVPMLARGMYLLSVRYGTKPFADLVVPAEQAAVGGVAISRALGRDLAQVRGPLLADPGVAAVFAPGGAALGEGATLVQADLAATLTQLGRVGVGDFYQGLLGQQLAESSTRVGGPMSLDDLRRGVAVLANPIVSRRPARTRWRSCRRRPMAGWGCGRFPVAGAQLDGDAKRGRPVGRGGGAMARAWRRPAGAAAGGRIQRHTPGAARLYQLRRRLISRGRRLRADLENLFGTGRIAPGTGILLGASPAIKPPPC